jgi:polar amino acid transport system substrate-binding protein
MNRAARVAIAWIAVLVLAGCNTLGLGSDSPVLDRIRSSGEIRVGMTGDYPPLSIIDRDEQMIGLEPELAQALAATLGVRLNVVRKPFAALLPALEAGEVDIVMAGMTMTPERNMRVAFAGPYFVSGKAILTRSETLARVSGPGALDRGSVTLVALEGTTSEGYVENAMPRAKLRTAPSYEEAIALVVSGEVDAMVADYPVCSVAVLRNPGAGLQTVASPFTFEPIGMAMPPDDMLFVNLVQNYLRSLEGTGLLDQLREKWFGDPTWLLGLP